MVSIKFLIWGFVFFGEIGLISDTPFAEKKRGVKGYLSLPWSVRYKVAVGVAESVAYLHSGTDRCVVHRDIKPSNILLSSKKIPKVGKLFGIRFHLNLV